MQTTRCTSTAAPMQAKCVASRSTSAKLVATCHSRPVVAGATAKLHGACASRIGGNPLQQAVNLNRAAATTTRAPQRSNTVRVQAFNRGSPGILDRAIGAGPYLLPLLDGLRYGKFLFMQFPVFYTILSPLQPLANLYFSVPFAGIAAFFAVYLGIINNFSLPRYVRFNAMQAVLLDIILILPGLIESVLRIGPMGGAGLQIYITIYNSIFLFLFVCVVYGMGACLAGQTAKLPFLAEAADQQVR